MKNFVPQSESIHQIILYGEIKLTARIVTQKTLGCPRLRWEGNIE
jgi:hypothetical protein